MEPNPIFLTGAQLKDKAKGALEGSYAKFVWITVMISLMTLAIQFVFEFLDSFCFSTVLIARELKTSGLTPQQLVVLLETTSYLEEYHLLYAVIDYVVQALVSILTSVFNVGLTLFCLNLACRRPLPVTDIFYGFRSQFLKSLKISAVFVLVSQLYLFPVQMLYLLIQNNTDKAQLVPVLCLLVIGTVIYIPLSLSISQSWLLLLDAPDYSAMEIIALSIRIMRGQKLRLFLIQLSFLPLILLGILSFGIGNLWLMPYINVTHTFFFLNLMHTRETAPASATRPDQTY